jgi:hypothetical protein
MQKMTELNIRYLYMDINDLVFSKNKNNEVECAGYKVNSILMQMSNPVMMTINKPTNKPSKTDKVSSLFQDLAIPAGIFYMNPSPGKKYNTNSSSTDLVDPGLYDKLLQLVNPEKEKNIYKNKQNKEPRKPRKTKKTKIRQKKQTRKKK